MNVGWWSFLGDVQNEVGRWQSGRYERYARGVRSRCLHIWGFSCLVRNPASLLGASVGPLYGLHLKKQMFVYLGDPYPSCRAFSDLRSLVLGLCAGIKTYIPGKGRTWDST